jgi:hypothetical protein
MGEVEGAIRHPVIKLERGGGTIVNINIGEGMICGDFIVDNFPEIPITTSCRGIEGLSIV